MPGWVSADALTLPRPLTSTVSSMGLASPQLTLLESGYTFRRYRVQSAAPTTLRFHQFYFPPWRITLDGQALQTYPSTDLGLLSVDVPRTADGTLEVDFASTLPELAGTYLSLAMAAAIIYRLHGRWLIGLALVAVLCSAAFIIRAAPAARVQPIHAQLEDVVELLSAQVSAGPYRAGDSLRVTLTWLARREMRENLSGFVHVQAEASGRIVAQSDGAPVGGFTPTTGGGTSAVRAENDTKLFLLRARLGNRLPTLLLLRLQSRRLRPPLRRGAIMVPLRMLHRHGAVSCCSGPLS